MDAITTADKDKLYDKVQARMARWYGITMERAGMSCLYYMHAGLVTLDQAGIQCVPAAGTAQWQIAPDTGSNHTYFAFEWGGSKEGARHATISAGKTPLPEMHCWIWLPQTQEVVDFSAGYIPTIAKALGFTFELPPPPSYIWARPKSLFPRSVYWPNRDATQYAIATLVADRKGTK